MNKKIIFGVMLSCFLLLVTPCINAVEYKEIKDDIKSKIMSNIDFLDFKNINNLNQIQLGKLSTIQLLILYYIFLYIYSFWFIIGQETLGEPMFTILEAIFSSFIMATMIFIITPFLLGKAIVC